MILLSSIRFHLLLLVIFCVGISKSSKEREQIDEVNEIFDKIQKNHGELKQVFEDILKENSKDETTKSPYEPVRGVFDQKVKGEECVCVPFYLCNTETGEMFRDGQHLLESRLNPSTCQQYEICCEQKFLNISMEMQTTTNPRCGYGYKSNTKLDFLDDDPMLSNFGEFPWTVMIHQRKKYTCVGSLIHPKVVLTAAHCVNATENVIVRAGEWNARTKTEPIPYQDKNVKQIIKHPEFQLDNLIYDVALLIVEEKFELRDNVNTACLTKSAPDPLITRSDQCVATGWGIDKPNGQYNKIMKKIGCSLVDYEECQEAFRTTRLGERFELHQSFICAYGQHGSDVCQGNGGAPLVCPIAEEPNRYQQVGITSWGIGCGEGRPSVFTKISQIKDWIDTVFDSLGYNKHYYTRV